MVNLKGRKERKARQEEMQALVRVADSVPLVVDSVIREKGGDLRAAFDHCCTMAEIGYEQEPTPEKVRYTIACDLAAAAIARLIMMQDGPASYWRSKMLADLGPQDGEALQ